MYLLGTDISFPPVTLADEDGLLAIGGDLSTAWLLAAYKLGIFPWYNEGEMIQWHSPDPRFVLFPQKLKVSKSMQHLLKKNAFEFTVNKDFTSVIENCRDAVREGQPGTWIHADIIKAYTKFHELGYACSAEVWQDEQLVGGLYGVLIGKVFFGESMFSLVSNASKYAFVNFVQHLQSKGIVLIDCQVYTRHLESFGAVMISREAFMKILSVLVGR